MAKTKVFLIAIVGVFVAAVALAVFVPTVNLRAQLVAMKLRGQLGDLGWDDIGIMIAPGSRYALSDLVANGNPYEAIRNIHGSHDDTAAGAAIFRTTCSGCHGAEAGGGAVGPALDLEHNEHVADLA